MKSNQIFIAAAFLLALVFMSIEGFQQGCYWSGTAPACAGSCETGEFVAAANAFGNGKTCITGVKKLCCRMPPQWLAQLPPILLLQMQQQSQRF